MSIKKIKKKHKIDNGNKKKLKDVIKKFKIERSISFLKEYSQCSTIHGVQHIFREGETVFHRIIWSVLFLICLSGATYMTLTSWMNYINHPIIISVEDTHYPLYDVVFPALSVCPTNKIIISKAYEYISNFTDSSLNDTEIKYFLTALTLFQHPVYSQMEYFLNNSRDILPVLQNINISELMLQSMPSCEDIFLKCYWRGIRKDCCQDLFSFQMSEEGFCYSFNSLTSKKYRNCSYLDVKKQGCLMKTNPSIGPTTGLEVFFKTFNTSNDEFIDLSGTPKFKVQVHSPNEYPEAGMNTMFPIGELNKLILAVQPTLTETSDDVRKMKEQDRGCTFKDENNPFLTQTFSQKTCLIECRIDQMLKLCGCYPYYFFRKDFSQSVCDSVQLGCILNISESLRFYKPPNYIEGFLYEDVVNALDCQHCLPTCNEVKYDVSTELSKDILLNKKDTLGGYIDLFYKTSGAVKYKRELTYDFVKLLVDLGGVGGLFLGGSLLSILEVIYWVIKSIISYNWPLSHDNFKRKRNFNHIKKHFGPPITFYD